MHITEMSFCGATSEADGIGSLRRGVCNGRLLRHRSAVISNKPKYNEAYTTYFGEPILGEAHFPNIHPHYLEAVT